MAALSLRRNVFLKFSKQNYFNFNQSSLNNLKFTWQAELHSGYFYTRCNAVLKRHRRKGAGDLAAYQRADDVEQFYTASTWKVPVRDNETASSEESTETNDEQKVLPFKFGNIRFDSHNVITHHGQFENDPSLQRFPRRNQRLIRGKTRYKHSNDVDDLSVNSYRRSHKHSISNRTSDDTFSYIDDQYFPTDNTHKENQESLTQPSNEFLDPKSAPESDITNQSNFIDHQYFSELFVTSNINNNDTNQSGSPEFERNFNSDTPFSSPDFSNSNAADQRMRKAKNEYSSNWRREEHNTLSSNKREQYDPFHVEYLTSDNITEDYPSSQPTYNHSVQKTMSSNKKKPNLQYDSENTDFEKPMKTERKTKKAKSVDLKAAEEHKSSSTFRPAKGLRSESESKDKTTSAYDFVMRKRKEEKLGTLKTDSNTSKKDSQNGTDD